jgi:hypothetical protein
MDTNNAIGARRQLLQCRKDTYKQDKAVALLVLRMGGFLPSCLTFVISSNTSDGATSAASN